jgi:PAS domain S-box-containing protein
VSARVVAPREPAALAGPTLDAATLRWLNATNAQGVLITDAQLRVRLWNGWLETQSGFTAYEILGHELLSLFPDLARRGLDAYFRSALQGQVHVLAQRLHRYLIPLPPSGDAEHCVMLQHATIAPLTAGGQVVGTVTLIQDVTERVLHEQALRERERFAEALLSSLPYPIAVLGYGGAVRAANTAWERLVEAQHPDTLGCLVGDNYLDACRMALATGDAAAERTLDAVTAVMEQLLTSCSLAAAADGGGRLEITPLAGEPGSVVLICHPG